MNFIKSPPAPNAVDTTVHSGMEQTPPTPPIRQAQDRLFQRGVTECLAGEARQ